MDPKGPEGGPGVIELQRRTGGGRPEGNAGALRGEEMLKKPPEPEGGPGGGVPWGSKGC